MIKGHQITIESSKLSDKRKVYEWLCLSETSRCHMGPPNFEDTPIPSWEEYCEDFKDYYFDGSKLNYGQLWIIKCGSEEIGAVCYCLSNEMTNSISIIHIDFNNLLDI